MSEIMHSIYLYSIASGGEGALLIKSSTGGILDQSKKDLSSAPSLHDWPAVCSIVNVLRSQWVWQNLESDSEIFISASSTSGFSYLNVFR